MLPDRTADSGKNRPERQSFMPSDQRDSSKSPRFAQPATFMRLPHQTDLTGVDAAILGVPFDGGTSYRVGARMGPREIRSQSSLIRPYSYFQKVSPFERLTVVDAGDVDAAPVDIAKAYAAIEGAVRGVLAAGAVPVVAGGDHSISLPVIRAVAAAHGPLSLVQFDAHLDTWGDYFGGKYWHGSPFRRAIEEGLIRDGGYVQVGIRGPMYGESDDFGFQIAHHVTTIDIAEVKTGGVARTIERVRSLVRGPLYVTFDIDAVDPAYAPGTGTPEVGGLTSYEAQSLIRGLAGLDLVGCDVVEVAPQFDGPGQITALLAANLLFELLCLVALKK
jgi:agmatinase